MPSTEEAEAFGFKTARGTLFVGGSPRGDLTDAVLSVEARLPLHGRAHAELHLLNWSGADLAFQDLRLGETVGIAFGPEEILVFEGEITGFEERYGDGAPVLVLLLEDLLHRLGRMRHNRRFEAMTAGDVVDEVIGEANLSGEIELGAANATWLQMNESNLAFIMRLASAQGIALRLAAGRVRAKAEEQDPDPVALNPDAGTAKSVRLVADLNHQPSRVSVQGHDLAADEGATHEVSALTPAPRGTTAADELARLRWDTGSVLPHPFARRQAEAEARATGQFSRAAARFVHGEILARGDPRLHAGGEVTLSGVSTRLRGTYRIADCTHLFGGGGYETRLTVQKADLA
ncbi:MAG: contractile injection system protein, VgrG/Pvc8 family [Pseudomonadota bacterium]